MNIVLYLINLVSIFLTEASTARIAMIDAARSRQLRLETVHIELEIERTYSKGSISKVNPNIARSKDFPAVETILNVSGSFYLHAQKMRSEQNLPGGSAVPGRFTSMKVVTIWDGKSIVTLHSEGFLEKQPQAIIHRETEPLTRLLMQLEPITLYYRGTAPVIAPYSLESMKLANAAIDIDGCRCQQFDLPRNGTGPIQLFVDPAAQFITRRISEIGNNGTVFNQIDIRYENDPLHGLIPVMWIVDHFDSTGRKTISTTLKAKTRINVPLANSLFVPEFAENWRVTDNRTFKNFRVQSDLTLRELGPSGEDLPVAKNEPEMAPVRTRWWLVGSAIALIAVLAIVFRRRRQTPDTASTIG